MSKSALFNKFKTDETLENDGVWVDFGDGIRVQVRRFKSRSVQDSKKRHEKPVTGELRKGPLDEKTANEIINKIIADAVIVNWEGVENEDGDSLPPTFENKLFILTNLTEFRDEIFAISTERDHFKTVLDDAAEKN